MGRIWGKLEDGEEYGQNMSYEKIIIKMYETATDGSRERVSNDSWMEVRRWGLERTKLGSGKAAFLEVEDGLALARRCSPVKKTWNG